MKRLTILLFGLILVGCNAGKNQTNIELIDNMMDQQAIKSQDWYPADGDKSQMRTPPENTVPRGVDVYPFPNDAEAADGLKNPLAQDLSPETLALGQKQYAIYCAVCHGDHGAGDGTVAEKMAIRPPSLLTDRARGYSDGRIFHIVTMGQGVMGSYGSQIPDPKKRWAVVNYMRNLQKGNK